MKTLITIFLITFTTFNLSYAEVRKSDFTSDYDFYVVDKTKETYSVKCGRFVYLGE